MQRTTMETIQWFIFLLASAVAMPIVIGSVYEMNFAEVSGLMQRTFFVVGLASMLQAVFGHRLPIMEGPAGIWVSIFTVMAATGGSLMQLETTMILTGIFLMLIGVFKISSKILPIFTPLVTGTFFFLLTVQLSGTFLEGMLGLQGSSTIQLADASIAFVTFAIVLGLSTFAKGWLKSYGVFIGIMLGWLMYAPIAGGQPVGEDLRLFAVPDVFAFGMPVLDWSVVPIAFVTAIILISNVVASVIAVSQTVGDTNGGSGTQVNRGTFTSGVNHGLAGVFSSIANVPLATSAGFIGLTGQKQKWPFVYASIILMAVAFFPPVVTFISAIPAPIANAALMATFVQLVGLAIRNVTMTELDSRKVTIVGVAYLIGMGTMFLPAEVFAEFPSFLQNLLSNGLLVGTGLVIVIEQLWKSES
ncbi:xanthine/uracil permease family protein [Gracilibacillus halophilus YIM-C55.5]|uniref:Xanthine/uracil permease family protein n=1 Tax=Gracilibacillus halophilus YIM-C55.5 TaxID=1308866 RepID=N4WAB5_9BACI|nr:purine/pyrimidine permease [Gracilibacillus halophilus]ENH96219.1 xanthine/uracil permease family protein [Gracilibacillus halophilus YIM-C55.5]